MEHLREMIVLPLVVLALICLATGNWTEAGLSLILTGIVWEIGDNRKQEKMWREFGQYLEEDNGDDH